MILARSVWLFVVTDLDKISIIEVTMALPILICSIRFLPIFPMARGFLETDRLPKEFAHQSERKDP